MNDEQQLWRDVQKFMNQFPGFVSVAKKIGEVGDLEAWQAITGALVLGTGAAFGYKKVKNRKKKGGRNAGSVLRTLG